MLFWGSLWELVGSLSDVFFESWGHLGSVWLRSWILHEFCLNSASHLDVVFMLFSVFSGMSFDGIFQFVPETYLSRFLRNMCAFRVPTGGSGEVFCKLSGVKEISWKVTFCVHRTPYIDFRHGSGWRFVDNFLTPGFQEALQMKKEARAKLFVD